MRKLITIMLALMATCEVFSQQLNLPTFCNPINISYRFTLDQPSKRIAADPVIVLYKENYFLFATQSGGYWHSSNLLEWEFVKTPDLPFEKDAPAAVVIRDTLYYMPMSSNVIYRAIDPIAGKWEIYSNSFPLVVGDPDIFVDTDDRIYFYYGCSNNDYIRGVELDINNKLNPKGKTADCLKGKPLEHGWERPGDYNTKTDNPWIEGPWMTKYNGKYYLQYAAPGTENKCYADGYYISNSPLGPFIYAPNNPFSAKPEGFINAAGHGCTFVDKFGNWWHIATMSISVKHMFERRLGLFPVTFDAEGNMITHTEFGDLPMIMPDHKYSDVSELFPGWMMLSYKKTGEASSSLTSNPISLAFDENVRDYWSAKTGNKSEWLSVDLGVTSTVKAIQINFAENNTQLFGRDNTLAQQYLLEYSNNKQTWTTLVDKTTNNEDLTHQYHAFITPILARYFRVTNYRVPDGTFAISGFRVFGLGAGSKPSKVTSFNKYRDENDSRDIKLQWNKQPNTTGYMVRFGHDRNKLYRSYQVYSDTMLTIRSLNVGQNYWFAIDAFGENGITPGDTLEGAINYKKGLLIEAESYDGRLGVSTEKCAENGLDVVCNHVLDYTFYKNIDFSSGVYLVDARVSSTIAGGIDIRLDSLKGALLGTIKVPITGGTQYWKTISINISGAAGVHNLYLVYRKVGVRLNWICLRENSINNQVQLFQNAEFGGWSAKFDVGAYNTAAIVAAGGVNNNALSIKVPIGWEVVAYDKDNFAGSSDTITCDNENLLSAYFANKISSMKIHIAFAVNTSAPSIDDKSSLHVYPNPCRNMVFIDGLSEKTDVNIADLLGKEIIHTKTSGGIDVSSLVGGLYVVRVGLSSNQTFKMVKL